MLIAMDSRRQGTTRSSPRSQKYTNDERAQLIRLTLMNEKLLLRVSIVIARYQEKLYGYVTYIATDMNQNRRYDIHINEVEKI
jgi:hypothetical protein